MNEFHGSEHERLARAAVDESRLLDGEDPGSTVAEDALHWLAVYRELANFKQSLLQEMGDSLPAMRGVTAAEVHSIDMVIVRQQLERYKRRIRFWEGRVTGLAAGKAQAQGGSGGHFPFRAQARKLDAEAQGQPNWQE
jgi:hypothetical protein